MMNIEEDVSLSNLQISNPSGLALINRNISKQCRICLSDEEKQNHILFSPCQCKGSLKYVHETCLQQWLKVKFENTFPKGDEGIECQLCHQHFFLNYTVNRKCKSATEIKINIINRKLLFSMNLIGILLTLALFLYSLIVLIESLNGSREFLLRQKIILPISVTISFLLILYFIYQSLGYFIVNTVKINILPKSFVNLQSD